MTMSAHHRPLDESDVILIRTIRETPSLYDPQLPQFRQSHRKEEDWMKVADALSISPADARRRWTCLRDRYSRELKQMRLHPSSEFGRNDFFRQMDFLRDFVRKRKERHRRERNQTPSGWIRVPMRARMLKVKPEMDSLIEEQDAHIAFEESEDHNYDTKLEVQTTKSETYSVLVEADDGQEEEEEPDDAYEEYMNEGVVEEEETKVMQPAHNVITLDPEEVPASKSATSTGTAVSQQGQGSDIDYVVCIQPEEKIATAAQQPTHPHAESNLSVSSVTIETEDDFFCKSVAAYLRQLSRVHKIKAKVEMYQILEKYILLEETKPGPCHRGGSS